MGSFVYADGAPIPKQTKYVDVNRLVYALFSEALTPLGVGFRRKVPSDGAAKMPLVVYAVTSPTSVANAAFRHGVRFTLVLNVISTNYPSVMLTADKVLELALGMGRVRSEVGRLTNVEVVSGIEDTSTSLSSKDLEQVSMVLTGIARKE